jgi:hypothetical protein
MTYASQAHVDGAGIFGVDAAEGAGEGVLLLGDGDEVDVIRHEAVAEDGDAVVAGVVFEELEVEPVVFGAEVCGLAVVTVLGDVVGDAWENQARRTWQTRIVGNSPETFSGVCRNCGEVPPRIYGGRRGTEVFDPIGTIGPIGAPSATPSARNCQREEVALRGDRGGHSGVDRSRLRVGLTSGRPLRPTLASIQQFVYHETWQTPSLSSFGAVLWKICAPSR